jgi:hypothetical protein
MFLIMHILGFLEKLEELKIVVDDGNRSFTVSSYMFTLYPISKI